jgi:hypothetical protein
MDNVAEQVVINVVYDLRTRQLTMKSSTQDSIVFMGILEFAKQVFHDQNAKKITPSNILMPSLVPPNGKV